MNKILIVQVQTQIISHFVGTSIDGVFKAWKAIRKNGIPENQSSKNSTAHAGVW